VARSFRPPGRSANTRPNCRGPIFLNPSLPLLHRLSPVSLLLWRDPTSPWASAGCRCLLPVYRSRGPTWISLSKNTECPSTPAPHYRPGLGWILGVAFVDMLTRPVRLAQGFTFVRCHGSPRASSPHGLTAPGLASLDGIAACSCLWLAVATNTPREGLSPPIQATRSPRSKTDLKMPAWRRDPKTCDSPDGKTRNHLNLTENQGLNLFGPRVIFWRRYTLHPHNGLRPNRCPGLVADLPSYRQALHATYRTDAAYLLLPAPRKTRGRRRSACDGS
jgi:hypothetical protein